MLMVFAVLTVLCIGGGIGLTYGRSVPETSASPVIPTGPILVTTTPPGAEIFAGAESMGVAPCAIARPGASVNLEARLSGYAPASFSLGPSSPSSENIGLTPAP